MPIPKTLREELKDKEFAHAYVDELLNIYIATQIKVLREQRDLSQENLAELAGMKQERVSVLENVNYSSWSINTLRKLAKAFDVRLRVSFETFGSGASDMKSFNRLALERMPREKEIEREEKAEKWTDVLLKTASASTSSIVEPPSITIISPGTTVRAVTAKDRIPTFSTPSNSKTTSAHIN